MLRYNACRTIPAKTTSFIQQTRSFSQTSKYMDGLLPKYFGVLEKLAQSGRTPQVYTTPSIIPKLLFLDLISVACTRSLITSEPKSRMELALRLETNTKKSSLATDAIFISLIVAISLITWGGLFGFYKNEPFPVLQCFWPDKEGHHPWDPACNADVVNLQPLLFELT